MSAKAQLEGIIRNGQLDFRSDFWKETLFMIQQNIYSETQCQMLIPDAMDFAEETEDKGIFLWRDPTEEELTAEGEPDIELGSLIESEQRFGIRLLDRPRNCLIIGSAGAGKSICTKAICLNVDRLNQVHPDNPSLLFIIDIKPGHLDLKDKLTGPTTVLSAINNLKFGLNAPEGVAPYIWIGQLSLSIPGRLRLFSSRSGFGSTVSSLLLVMNPGLKEQDLKDPSVSKHLKWPSLRMVLKAIQNNKISDILFSKANYTQSLRDALSGLIHDSGDIFECCNGIDLNDAIKQKRHLILNISTLPSYVTHIVTDICINQVLVKRMTENYITSHTDVIFVLDESDLLLASDVSNFPDLSPLDRLFRLGRSMGIMSLVCVSGM